MKIFLKMKIAFLFSLEKTISMSFFSTIKRERKKRVRYFSVSFRMPKRTADPNSESKGKKRICLESNLRRFSEDVRIRGITLRSYSHLIIGIKHPRLSKTVGNRDAHPGKQ